MTPETPTDAPDPAADDGRRVSERAPRPVPGAAAPRPVPVPLRRARTIAHLLDAAFRLPGTRFRFGLDPLLGLLPGPGDAASWVVGSHLVWAGWRMKADAATLMRMGGHLLLDLVVGAIPFLGDLFDFAYRANTRNLKILERLHADPTATRRASVGWLVGVLAVSGVVVGGIAWGSWWAISTVLGGLLGG